MIMNFLIFINILLSISFMVMNHPLTMGFILIIQSISVAFLMGMISQSFWFSYILFLVIIGGMLILFMYVISLIFNKIFLNKLNLNPIFLVTILMMMMLINNNQLMINNYDIFMNFNFLNLEISINLLKLYNYPMNLLNLLMINYLFFLLIVVVKITNFYYGPLRMKI